MPASPPYWSTDNEPVPDPNGGSSSSLSFDEIMEMITAGVGLVVQTVGGIVEVVDADPTTQTVTGSNGVVYLPSNVVPAGDPWWERTENLPAVVLMVGLIAWAISR
jgi:hypothetical protein